MGAYIQLYNADAQSFSESTNLPPQGSGYIELICCVPTGWQKLNVTFVPTFVANKSLTFTLSRYCTGLKAFFPDEIPSHGQIFPHKIL